MPPLMSFLSLLYKEPFQVTADEDAKPRLHCNLYTWKVQYDWLFQNLLPETQVTGHEQHIVMQ